MLFFLGKGHYQADPPINHTIILVPGLGDTHPLSRFVLRLATLRWQQAGFKVAIHRVGWRDGGSYAAKLRTLVEHIDQLADEGPLSLIGTSAGASLALNSFLERPRSINKVINVCGRLRAGHHYWRSLGRMAQTSSAFKTSVETFEKNESELSASDRARILTVRPFFGDELVPQDTAAMPGATNRWIYLPGHMAGIFWSLLLAEPLWEFLRSELPRTTIAPKARREFLQ